MVIFFYKFTQGAFHLVTCLYFSDKDSAIKTELNMNYALKHDIYACLMNNVCLSVSLSVCSLHISEPFIQCTIHIWQIFYWVSAEGVWLRHSGFMALLDRYLILKSGLVTKHKDKLQWLLNTHLRWGYRTRGSNAPPHEIPLKGAHGEADVNKLEISLVVTCYSEKGNNCRRLNKTVWVWGHGL